MRRRGAREINIFNIAFLDVITGALGAFVLLVVMLAASLRSGGGGGSAAEEARLRALVNQLSQSLEQMKEINRSLAQNNEMLKTEYEAQSAKVDHLTKIRPVVVVTEWNCHDAGVAIYAEAPGRSEKGLEMPPFDPSLGNQNQFWIGSSHLPSSKAGVTDEEFTRTDLWIYRVGTDTPNLRVFYALIVPFQKGPCRVQSVFINASGGFYGPGIDLSPRRPWAIAALSNINENGDITVKPGDEHALTPVERENVDRWLEKTASDRRNLMH